MGFWTMALTLLSKVPLEKFLIKPASNDKEEAFYRHLENKANKTPSPPREIAIKEPEPLTKTPAELPSSPRELITKQGRINDADIIAYQKREIGKALLLFQTHLQQRCKIGGKACDCCEKHPLLIEALAEESLGIMGDPVYQEIADWARELAPITTETASASLKYDEIYPAEAIKARKFRKAVMGTDEVAALVSPELSKKVKSDLNEIIERMKRETTKDQKEVS